MTPHQKHKIKLRLEKAPLYANCYICDGDGRICDNCSMPNCKCKVGLVRICVKCQGKGKIRTVEFEKLNVTEPKGAMKISNNDASKIMNSEKKSGDLAKQFNVSIATIYAIRNGRRKNATKKSC